MFYAFGAQVLFHRKREVGGGGGWWGVGGVSLQRPTMLAYVREGFYGQSSV